MSRLGMTIQTFLSHRHFLNFLLIDISPINWRMTSLGNGRINSRDVSSKKTSCFSFIQTLKFRMLELYCSQVLGTNRSSLISAAIVVPSRRSALSEVDDDIILLTIWLYYVFNDCTKTSTTTVTRRIKLHRGLVYVTGVGQFIHHTNFQPK